MDEKHLDIVTFFYDGWWNLQGVKDTRKLGYKYLDVFAKMVGRWAPFSYRLILYTDDSLYENDSYLIRYLPEYMAKYKRQDRVGMNLKRMITFDKEQEINSHCIIMDPDIIIKKDLSPLLSLDGLLFTNSNPKKLTPGGGLYLTTQRESLSERLWEPVRDNFEYAFQVSDGGRDRGWVREQVGLKNIKYFQKELPGFVVSGRLSSSGEARKATILWCHGNPKPHNMNNEWSRKYWK